MAIHTDDTLDGIVLRNGKWSDNVSTDTISAKVEMTTDEVTQLTIAIDDPGLKILSKSHLPLGAPMTYQKLKLSIASIEVGGDESETLTVVARPRVVRALKKRRGKMVMKGLSPSEFVRIETEKAGGEAVCQSTSSRTSIARDVRPKGEDSGDQYSSWSTFQRLAGEVGFIVFEYGGKIYFGEPTWLIKRHTAQVVRWDSDPADRDEGKTYATAIPNCRKSEDDEGRSTVTLSVDRKRAHLFRPGLGVRLEGVPGFNKTFLISAVAYDIASAETDVEITAVTPHDPTPQEKSE